MPATIIKAGLKGQESKLAGVYALLSSDYTKGTPGWEAVVHVGVSQDLKLTLDSLNNVDFKHVRALSFSFPQPVAMQDVADDWKRQAVEAGARLQPNVVDASAYLYNNDEDDDDEFDDEEDDDWSVESVAQAVATVSSSSSAADAIVSPFDDETKETAAPEAALPKVTPSEPGSLQLSVESVDSTLDEVRPYLIADGGNVAVKDVDVATKTVFLQLEGACGSCPSSTVTMQMGIERVLKENFGPDVKVEQVDDQDDQKPTSLTMQAVQDEVDRIKPAIIAMGGVVRVLSVDADTGVVKVQFRGASRVQQGLELALRDLPFVNAVQFVMGDDE